MSDYEDPNAEWNAQFEQDPAAAAYQLAQTAIAQHEYENARGYDEQRVAANAAAMLAQAEAQRVAQQRAAAVGQTVDRSMAAAHGEDWVKHSSTVGARLAADEQFAQVAGSDDTNAMLQYVDGIYQQVVNASDPTKAEWEKIANAGQVEYWQNPAVRSVIGDIQNRGR